MSDITREEAIKILKDTLYDERTPNNYIQAVRMGREALENQKTGHWILADEQSPEDVSNDNYRYICSVCGHSDISSKSVKVNYCWYCGAKMEGE